MPSSCSCLLRKSIESRFIFLSSSFPRVIRLIQKCLLVSSTSHYKRRAERYGTIYTWKVLEGLITRVPGSAVALLPGKFLQSGKGLQEISII